MPSSPPAFTCRSVAFVAVAVDAVGDGTAGIGETVAAGTVAAVGTAVAAGTFVVAGTVAAAAVAAGVAVAAAGTVAVAAVAAAASSAVAGTVTAAGTAAAGFVHGLVVAVSVSSALFYLCYTTLAVSPTAFVARLYRSAMRLLRGGVVYDDEVVGVGLGGVSVTIAVAVTVHCPLC
jgi:hypothetical protein